MNPIFVVMFKVWENGSFYSSLCNYYFKTEKAAKHYALSFVSNSDTFSEFVIREIIPNIHYEKNF